MHAPESVKTIDANYSRFALKADELTDAKVAEIAKALSRLFNDK